MICPFKTYKQFYTLALICTRNQALISWYLKLKTASFIFLRMEADFSFILCYHASHLQQIHWSKLLCGMFGLTAKSSVARLNICQILMRYVSITAWSLSDLSQSQPLPLEYDNTYQGKEQSIILEWYLSSFWLN